MAVDNIEAMKRARELAVNRANAEQQFPSKEMIDSYAVRFYLQYIHPPGLASQMNLGRDSLATPPVDG